MGRMLNYLEAERLWGSYFYFSFPGDEDQGEAGGDRTEDGEAQRPHRTQLKPLDLL